MCPWTCNICLNNIKIENRKCDINERERERERGQCMELNSSTGLRGQIWECEKLCGSRTRKFGVWTSTLTFICVVMDPNVCYVRYCGGLKHYFLYLWLVLTKLKKILCLYLKNENDTNYFNYKNKTIVIYIFMFKE